MKCLPVICTAVLSVLFALQGCSTTSSPSRASTVIEQGESLPGQPANHPGQPASARTDGAYATPATVTHQPAAVVALLKQAEGQANAGELDAAAASLERAIRIDPRNPLLWYHLATIRLSQENPAQAEQLASKSNSLAPGNYVQQSRGWLLIAAARRQQNNVAGAASAEQRARELAAH